MASLPSIPGPNRCEPSLTWKLRVSAARKSFSRQVHSLRFVKDYIWDANHSGMFVSAFLPVCVAEVYAVSFKNTSKSKKGKGEKCALLKAQCVRFRDT